MTNQKKKCKNVGEKKKHQHLSKNKKKQSIEKQSFSFMFVMKHNTLNWYEVVFVIILHSQTLPTEFLTYYLQILSLTFYMKT